MSAANSGHLLSAFAPKMGIPVLLILPLVQRMHAQAERTLHA